jgi:hypothetical protein
MQVKAIPANAKAAGRERFDLEQGKPQVKAISGPSHQAIVNACRRVA